MNLDARTGRNWRRSRKKGVSPIIATILLVAITVVLAAVLYVLISGLTKGPGNTPIGSAFAFGPGSNISATSPTTIPQGCASAKECYQLEIASASSGLTANSISFTARSAAGATVSVTGWTFKLLSSAGNLNITTGNTATWTAAGTCSGGACTATLAGGMSIIVNTGVTLGATSSLSGDTILAVGQGSFQGTVASAALPA